MDQLTPREYQVAMLVARGLSNKEIARELGVIDGTAKLHVHKILGKIGAKNRYDLWVKLRDQLIAQAVRCPLCGWQAVPGPAAPSRTARRVSPNPGSLSQEQNEPLRVKELAEAGQVCDQELEVERA
jgi:DNA-binding CsgD family transcriptional regulator